MPPMAKLSITPDLVSQAAEALRAACQEPSIITIQAQIAEALSARETRP